MTEEERTEFWEQDDSEAFAEEMPECVIPLYDMTTDDDLSELEDMLVNEEGVSIVRCILNEMEEAVDDDSLKLLKLYQNAGTNGRAIMDYMLTCLCGWSLHHLIVMMSGKEPEPDLIKEGIR